jgi:serine/threonine-protein kinase
MAHPATIGRYTVASEIGRGSMGIVYEAVDPVLQRAVAIKTIDTALHAQELEHYEERFVAEARAAGSLNHPNIVTIYEVGRSGELTYIAMEFLEGPDLKRLMRASPLTPERALEIAAQVADGLAYAHERGVVHRDIKPANIMILPGDRVKITDFGIARVRSAEARTHTGVILGSPRYLSPEQIVGRGCDARSDIFSLGVIVHEAVTGQAPFEGSDVNSIMYQILHVKPPAPSALSPKLPGMLDLILAKALAKNAEDRYASAAELAVDLRECRRLGADTAASVAPIAAVPSESNEVAAVTAELLADTLTQSVGSASDAITPTVAVAGYGLARNFDSTQALMRIESGAAAQANGSATSPGVGPIRADRRAGLRIEAAREPALPAEHPGWSRRERRTFFGAVIGALLVGTMIVFV